MEQSGGEIAAKRAKPSEDDAGVDRLSEFPEDVLVLILLRIDTAAAGRTSVLSCQEVGEIGTFELPCLERAAVVSLDLGFLGLAVQPAGVFARLTELFLSRVWFHGQCELVDVVSSPRCPSLQKLSVRDAHGLVNLAIHSESRAAKAVWGHAKEAGART
ncbi:uncharacterized protein LOC133929633 [Phragmites australis]|uniref:uncharacterized protein LOC133929633 n=1 Tax=Phragmites australis TaxID=29695 RepID=UPI002D785AA5|nr:uncharacterized protein LOC133929633 [Phragmites australis]